MDMVSPSVAFLAEAPRVVPGGLLYSSGRISTSCRFSDIGASKDNKCRELSSKVDRARGKADDGDIP